MSRASQYADSVSEIYRQDANERRDAILANSRGWAGTLANLAQLPLVYQERQAQEKRQASEDAYKAQRAKVSELELRSAERKETADAEVQAALKDASSPFEAVQKLQQVNPEAAQKLALQNGEQGLKLIQQMQRGNAPAIRAAFERFAGPQDDATFPTQFADDAALLAFKRQALLDHGTSVEAFLRATQPAAPEKPAVDWVEQMQDGKKVKTAVERVPGATYEVPPVELTPDQQADNARADKQLGISQSQLDLAKQRERRQAAGGGSGGGGAAAASGIPSNYALLLNRATLSIPAVRRPAIIATAKMAFDQGGEEALKDVIRQAAVDTENVDTRNQVLGRAATIASLKDASAILDEMERAGVPTNFLKGTAEDLARKLGTSTNPQYVELANRLQGTLINYRRSATGVQFGEREGAEYARMFPNYKNTLPVNKALIAGLLREMGTYDTAYWTHKLGPGGGSLVGLKDAGDAPPPAKKAGGDPLGIR